MKQIIINISDSTLEKLRFEAIYERKNIEQILKERIFHKPFNHIVLEAYNRWVDQETHALIKE